MAGLTYRLLSVTAVLSAVHLISGYSFNNCIEDSLSKGESFKCIRRKEKNLSAIVSDLPQSTINLTITINPVRHIPNGSFVHLPNLQDIRIDHNYLNTIDHLAFRSLHHLKSLNLSYNYISDLSPSLFNDLHSLEFLSLTNNKLKQLPEGIFSNVLNLQSLIIRKNFLTSFSGIVATVSHLKNLTTLDLCFNNLTSLNHSNESLPNSLTKLFLCRNALSTLGCEYSSLKFIQILDLSYNFKLPTAAFHGVDLRHVNYLRLRSTSVKIVEFLNISNVNPGHVDFSGTGLKNDTLLIELCRLLKRDLKKLRDLDLNSNGIQSLTNQTLFYCPEISGFLDLSQNQLKQTSCLDFLENQRKVTAVTIEHNHFASLPSCREKGVTFSNLKLLSIRYNRIFSVNAHAFHHTPQLKTLKLNINSIAFLHQEALNGLHDLETLRLDNNLLTDLFKSTFKDLFNLQILNLRNNRISVIFNGTFLSLENLTTLDLGNNKITQFQPSGFAGLKLLSKLYLDGNNLKVIDSSLWSVFQHTLTVLDLAGNQIHFIKDIALTPFKNLKKLYDLKMDDQRPYGLTVLPRTLFRGLYSLKSLCLTNNKIIYLDPGVFDDLRSLNFLSMDNCCVGVTQLQPGVFKNLRNLTKLALENMGIQNFSKAVFGNLTKLHSIQLNNNVMQTIPVDALESLPELHYIDIRNTPLSCTCMNRLLRNWTLNNLNVQVVYLYQFTCPHDAKVKFYKFDTKVCYIDLGEYLFLSTSLAVFLLTIIPLLHVKLYWKIKYGYYVLSSWFNEQWRRLREEEENCKYDAFISYNSSDEQWVMNQLMPNLEGDGSSFKLCLHHRDFEPGRYIIDNIVSAVYSSRKTICVVSRNFLRSEWCSLEIQMASYRLFHEQRDVLLLVFLEPISERQLSSYHRMRKVMLKRTYLQWPISDCTNPSDAQNLFWKQLRRALRTGSRPEKEEDQSDEEETKETEHSETLTDENYYLLP
ncbi:toll-like receptor 21 [Brachionichthys hirsutus]|uniref:toll-like receptor 21 n=1 Tax=Brachionichthys hirsutus TaxID=412623 RepID=UPI003604EFF9